ncbi:MAG: hypothetical protein OIN86_13065 [Candidatus Methanoperedens sp.]|nr:hypothetical protein [Candidatus Methanoperedens sp.]CAG0948931.1 hypothetical protein METP1_00068 [Methanosarcinales archaeon]
MIRKITVIECECEKCGYKWIPKDGKTPPKICGKCKSYAWNKA